MTNYTFHADAVELMDRITNAPDLASKLNLIDELRGSYISLATQTQMLAESNDRWARESANKKAGVEAIIDGLLALYPDEENQPDAIKELANLFDIDLDVELSVTVKLEYSLTVTAPRGTTADDIEEAIEWQAQKFTGKDGWEVHTHNWGNPDDCEVEVASN